MGLVEARESLEDERLSESGSGQTVCKLLT